MKTMETLLILAIFLFILGIVLIVFTKISSLSQRDKLADRIQMKSIEIAQTVAYMPELQCTTKNVGVDNCFDIYKVAALARLLEDEPEDIRDGYYYNIFEYSNITIQEIYPGNQQHVVYTKVKEDSTTMRVTNIPTTLYDPITEKNSFAVLVIESFR